MSNIPKICLNMIVKNESNIITRLLNSVINLIDYYVICDTGSTDNTVDIIKQFFKNKNITGHIIHTSFINFGKTRTYALQQCKNFFDFDYILLLDADMLLYINPDINVNVFKSKLMFDSYNILQCSSKLQYQNIRLIKSSINFYYTGSTHEFIDCEHTYTVGNIAKDQIHIYDVGDGGCKTDKFKRDIELLITDLKHNPDDKRTIFYLANSYKDIKDYKNAIINYNKRIQLLGWKQEIWCCYYYKGLCYMHLNDPSNAIMSWLDGFQYIPERIETLYQIIHYYRCNEKYIIANHFCDIAMIYKQRFNDPNALFLCKDIYDYLLDFEYSIIGYYAGKSSMFMSNFSMNLLNNSYIPYNTINIILNNYKYYSLGIHKLSNSCINTDDINTNFNINMKHKYEFHQSTPTITIHNNKLYVIVRYINYYIDEQGNYKCKNDKGELIHCNDVTTRNICGIFNIDADRFIHEQTIEIPYNTKYDDTYAGIEDMRICIFNDQIYFTGNRVITNNGNLIINVEYGSLNIENNQIQTQTTLLTIDNQNNVEKNWVLLNHNNEQKIVYNWFPITIYSLKDVQISNNLNTSNIKFTEKINTPPIFKYVRGSTNGIKIDNEIWFITHLVSYAEKRNYYHMFVILDSNTLQIKKYSTIFTFANKPIEYCLGLEYIEQYKQFLISYSINDDNPQYMFISHDIITKLLL